MNAFSLGGYWTHIALSGVYADTGLMGTTSAVDPNSLMRSTTSTCANAFTASVEGGVPFVLSQNATLQPQAQLIYLHRRTEKDAANRALNDCSCQHQPLNFPSERLPRR